MPVAPEQAVETRASGVIRDAARSGINRTVEEVVPQFPSWYLVSVSHRDHPLPERSFVIISDGSGPTEGTRVGIRTLAGKGSERFSVTKIYAGMDFSDVGDKKRNKHYHDPRAIVFDLMLQMENYGVIACDNPAALTEADIAYAERKRDARNAALVQEADELWTKARNPKLINDMYRNAHDDLGVKPEREWRNKVQVSTSEIPVGMKACPHCDEHIKIKASVCKHCGSAVELETVAAMPELTPDQKAAAAEFKKDEEARDAQLLADAATFDPAKPTDKGIPSKAQGLSTDEILDKPTTDAPVTAGVKMVDRKLKATDIKL